MERHYTILTDRGGRFPARHLLGRSEFEQPLEMASRLMADPPQPAIHRERLTAPELQELEQEPDFVAAAEIMRTRLLAPVADEVAQEVGPTVTRRATKGRHRQSWGIGAVEADKSKFTGAGVTVALLDTGIDASHLAFDGVELVERDFTGFGNGDLDGHGTHCAGVLFGRNVEGVRIGVAPGIRSALIGKIVGPEGGDTDMMVRGVCWAHEAGARVISMSAGFDFDATLNERLAQGWPNGLATSATLEAYRSNLKLLDRLLQMLRLQEPSTGGAIIVAAAGNDSSRDSAGEFVTSACPPASSDKVISVGSIDPDSTGTGYRVSSFSNSSVEIVAPGRNIVSAGVGGGLKAMSGTSVAAPHVAGVAALWWQAVRQSELPANATLVRGKLFEGARSVGFAPAVHPAERGAGRIVAPRDGLAVSARPAAAAAEWRDQLCPEHLEIGAKLAAGAIVEPISVGAEAANTALSRSRRSLS